MEYLLVKGNMKTKDIVLLLDNLDLIKKAKEVGVTTFLFPVKDYTVGFLNTFDINDIKEESFLLINRNLTNDDIDNLKKILKKLPSNIKGIVFEDLGLINVLKDTNLIKIYNAKHLNCSTKSVLAMLKYVDSVILSTDLTEEEITNILNNTNKRCSIYAFGLNQIMYSRRTLLSNYAKEYNLDNNNNIEVLESISNQIFKVVENEYGTVFYPKKFYDATRLFKNDNVLYYFVNLSFLDNDNCYKILDNDFSLDGLDIETSSYNLDSETYYKLPPKEGDKNA